MTIATAAMADAIRSVTVEQGQDPRHAVLLAFGGAGPLFATLLSSELQIERALVPRHAGGFAAWGLLGQALTRSAAHTSLMPLTADSLESANEILARLFTSLDERVGSNGHHAEDVTERETAIDLRYLGQEHTLTVRVPNADGAISATREEIEGLFADEYDRVFGHSLEGPVEIVSLRASSRTLLPDREEAAPPESSGTRRQLNAYSFTRGERMTFDVVARSTIQPGETLVGPLIVSEQTTTTYVDAGVELRALDAGPLELTNL